jgi:Carboxypeptidase regulatory-like domain
MKIGVVVRTVLFALACAQPGTAQVIRGRVVDDATGTPLISVTVSLLDAQGGTTAQSATDSTGLFEVRAADAGSFALSVQQLGFRSWTSEPLHLRRNETVQVEVRLGRQAIPLQPLIVAARRVPARNRMEEFETRRKSPTRAGYYLTRSDFEHRPIASPAEQLVGIPGVTVRPAMSGGIATGADRNIVLLPAGVGGEECMANVYVDGVPVRQSSGSTIDDMLDKDLLGGVEVYPRATSAPIEYQSDPDCGVVLFWTRPGESDRGWSWPRIAIGTGLAILLGVVAFGVH